MKVNALFLCLVIVPLVAAQAPVSTEERPILGFFQNFWNDLTSGSIDTDRYRQDISTRWQSGLDLIEEGWNRTKAALEQFELDIPEPDVPTAEEIIDEINQGYEQFKAIVDKHMDKFQEKVQSFDPFNLNEEYEAEPEPVQEPTPTPEVEAPVKKWYDWW